ncbi:PIN domain-like protein, partial [Mycena vulgaris]
LEAAKQQRAFHQLTLTEGFEGNHHEFGALRLGIDTSIWFAECTAALNAPARRYQTSENPELESLFYKLCELLRYSVTAIFVFDGPNRPDFKRGTLVNKTPHPLTDPFQSMITAFGFHYYTAPGEAEAELAWLNRMNVIDVIFTTDSDVFVFGASHVIYSPKKADYKDIHIYTSEAIASEANLSHGGILLMALLIGGDYDETGLAGCGKTVAYGLAQLGLGDSLLFAAETLQPADLRWFLDVWRKVLRNELIGGKLGRKYPAIAAALSSAFPDLSILNLYVNPVTSWSSNGPGVDASGWVPEMPDIVSITRLCEKLFVWGTTAELPNKLFNVLLPGMCLKRLVQVDVSPYDELKLLQDHVLHGWTKEIDPPLSSFICVNK